VRGAVGGGDHFLGVLGVADLGPQAFERDLVARCYDDGPLDNILELATLPG
jgi:hypothetical protein